MLTDLHCHLLPAIDDGAKDVTESIAMVRSLAEQGVGRIVATPHFLPGKHHLSSFLEKRTQCITQLKQALTQSDLTDIQLLSGAEVYLNSSFFSIQDPTPLCIEGTRKLLVELSPSIVMSDRLIRKFIQLQTDYNITPVLAHAERYPGLTFQDNNMQQLLYAGCNIQVTLSSLLHFKTGKKIAHWLKKDWVHAVGTDGHNVTSRAPDFSAGAARICKIIKDKNLQDNILQALDIWR